MTDIGVHIDSRSIEGEHRIGPTFKQTNEDGKILKFALIAGGLKEPIELDQHSTKQMKMEDIEVRIDIRSIEEAHRIGPAFNEANEDGKILEFTLIAGRLKEPIE